MDNRIDSNTSSSSRSGTQGGAPDRNPGLLRFRMPRPADGDAIHRLVKRCPNLDGNSLYAYLLLCEDFQDTCRVAVLKDTIVGFASAYRRPRHPDTLFVWQIATDPDHRGRGIASGLLHSLVSEEARRTPLRAIEATVTESNRASRALFESLCRRLDGHLSWGSGFPGELFQSHDHEPEPRLRITPDPRSGLHSIQAPE